MTDQAIEAERPAHREIVDLLGPLGDVHVRCVFLYKAEEGDPIVLDRMWLEHDTQVYEADSFFRGIRPWAVFWFSNEWTDYQWRPSEVQDFAKIVAARTEEVQSDRG